MVKRGAATVLACTGSAAGCKGGSHSQFRIHNAEFTIHKRVSRLRDDEDGRDQQCDEQRAAHEDGNHETGDEAKGENGSFHVIS